MLRIRPIAVLFFAALAACLVPPDSRAQKLFRWKLQPGETMGYIMDQDMVQYTNIGGAEIKTAVKTRFDLTWKVGDVQDNSTEMAQTIDRIRATIESSGFDYQYDSHDPPQGQGPAAVMSQLFNTLVGVEFRFRMSPRGEISNAQIPEKLLEALKKLPSGAQVGAMFSEENLKKMVGESSALPLLPEDEIEEGKSWQVNRQLDNPILGKQKIAMTYTYQGTETAGEEQLETISVVGTVEFEPTQTEKPLEMKLEIQDQTFSGSIQFDATAGRLVRSEMTQKMVIKVEAAGQKFDQNVVVTQKMRLTSSLDGADQNPDEPPSEEPRSQKSPDEEPRVEESEQPGEAAPIHAIYGTRT